MVTHRIGDEDPAGLTLARLADLVDWCREHDVPMDTVVPKVRVRWGGWLRAITLDIDEVLVPPTRATAEDVRR